MIAITDDTTRFDLLNALAREAFGIADPDAPLDSDSDAYRWRWCMDEFVQQMSEDEFRGAFDYLCRMHDIDVIELDTVASVIMSALDCTPEAAQGLREWVFDATSDDTASLEQLRADLEHFGAWYLDDDALKDDCYTYFDGTLYEQTAFDEQPVSCEADAWYDMSYGYFIMWH